MSKANPRKAMAALLPMPIKVGGGDKAYTVRPMTLAMYAALERIASPLVTGVDAKDMVELLPSAYLLTHGAKEIFRGNLLELAMDWADTVPVDTLARIRDACRRQIEAVKDVIPQGDPPKKKTDGWICYLAYWVCSTFHWSLDEALYDVPLSAIVLLQRQESLKENKIFPLQSIEEIDDGNEEAQG